MGLALKGVMDSSRTRGKDRKNERKKEEEKKKSNFCS